MSNQEIPVFMEPQWFIPMFAAMWFGITCLLAHVGGWVNLASNFRTEQAVDGRRFRFASGSMGWKFLPVSYGNCLFVTVSTSGLCLSILFLFRFQSPPLFIPWSDIESVTEKRFLFLFSYVVIVVKDHWPQISLRGGAGDSVYQAFLAYSGTCSNNRFQNDASKATRA